MTRSTDRIPSTTLPDATDAARAPGRARVVARRELLAWGAGGALGAWGLAGTGTARAQEMSNTLPDLIDRSRQAVVAVGTFAATDNPRFGFRGTGFAVGDGRRIVTCAHVVPNPVEKDLMITVPAAGNAAAQPPPGGGKLRCPDAARALAIPGLADDKGALVDVLSLAEVDGDRPVVREGAAVALMGYPIGTALGVTMATHRGSIAAITRAALPAPSSNALSERAVRQLREGALEFLQLDATAYPGNSGGPLLDIRTGKVVGVVNMVALKGTRESALSAPSGISYAVPVKYVWPLLDK